MLQQISSACDKPTYPCRQVWRMPSPCGRKPLVDSSPASRCAGIYGELFSYLPSILFESKGGNEDNIVDRWKKKSPLSTTQGFYMRRLWLLHWVGRVREAQLDIAGWGSGAGHVTKVPRCACVISHLQLWALLFPPALICWLAPHRLCSHKDFKPSINWPQSFFHYWQVKEKINLRKM